MTQTEAKNKTGIHISHIASERIDVRRNKKYGLELTVGVNLGEHAVCDDCGIGKRVRLAEIAQNLPMLRNSYSSFSGYAHSWRDCQNGDANRKHRWTDSCRITFWLPSPRPSETVGEHAALRIIANRCPENQDRGDNPLLSLEEILAQRILRVLENAETQGNREETARQANILVNHLTKTADEEARKAINWPEKLAALEAELRSAQKAALARLIAEEFDASLRESETAWEPRAAELAKQKAGEHLPSPLGRGFPSSHEAAVKVEDV